MTYKRFPYAAEKLNAARAMLMLPFPNGEAHAIGLAFHECYLGLGKIPLDDLDDDARAWVRDLRELMDTTGVSDPSGLGTWFVKAESLSFDERTTLSRTVDELAHWFAREEMP